MDQQKLVAMANQIAAFFAADPDRKAAVEGVVGHLKRFWEPRMRRALLARFDDGTADGMHDLVVTALKDRRDELEPVA